MSIFSGELAAAFRLDALAHRGAARFDSARLCEECALAVEQGNPHPLSTSMRGIERDVGSVEPKHVLRTVDLDDQTFVTVYSDGGLYFSTGDDYYDVQVPPGKARELASALRLVFFF